MESFNPKQKSEGLGDTIAKITSATGLDKVAEALAKGLLINVTNSNTIRLLPPLIISDAEADLIVDTVSDLIVHFIKNA